MVFAAPSSMAVADSNLGVAAAAAAATLLPLATLWLLLCFCTVRRLRLGVGLRRGTGDFVACCCAALQWSCASLPEHPLGWVSVKAVRAAAPLTSAMRLLVQPAADFRWPPAQRLVESVLGWLRT